MNDLAIPVAPTFAPGFFPQMPAEQYHRTEAMSTGGAKKILRSPAHYKLMRDTPNKPTAAMQFGTACHLGVLEPATFDERVACAPVCDRRTKIGKETWADFEFANEGKLILSSDDHDRAGRCIDAVRSHPMARNLLHGAQIEGSLFWYDGRYGVPCKARFDARNHGGLIDLKTCEDASPEGFGRAAASYLYHLQAAFYFSGAEHVLNATPEFFTFICVESEPPHCVACYVIDGAAALAGAHLMNVALERYALALKTGRFSGYPETIERLQLPKWSLTFNV